jgi:hypothetical protein
LGGHAQVTGSRAKICVAEQHLNGTKIGALVQQMRRETMAEDILIVLISLIEPRSAIAITLCTV